jgi:hypothetical protein
VPLKSDTTSGAWVQIVGDLARPFAIIAVAIGVVICAVRGDPETLAAAGAALAALYTAKTVENSIQANANAAIANATTSAAP